MRDPESSLNGTQKVELAAFPAGSLIGFPAAACPPCVPPSCCSKPKPAPPLEMFSLTKSCDESFNFLLFTYLSSLIVAALHQAKAGG